MKNILKSIKFISIIIAISIVFNSVSITSFAVEREPEILYDGSQYTYDGEDVTYTMNVFLKFFDHIEKEYKNYSAFKQFGMVSALSQINDQEAYVYLMQKGLNDDVLDEMIDECSQSMVMEPSIHKKLDFIEKTFPGKYKISREMAYVEHSIVCRGLISNIIASVFWLLEDIFEKE